jgi:hypothetical protein
VSLCRPEMHPQLKLQNCAYCFRPVRPCVRPSRPHGTIQEQLNVFLILILGNFTKICRHSPVLIETGQHNGNFIRRPTCVSARGNDWVGNPQQADKRISNYCKAAKLIALMMEAARTSETLVNFYQTTRCQSCYAMRTFAILVQDKT